MSVTAAAPASTPAFDVGTYITENYDMFMAIINGLVGMFNLSVLSAAWSREDLVNEAFLALWAKKDSYEPEKGSVEKWGSTVMCNRLIDIFRKEKGELEHITKVEDVQNYTDVLTNSEKCHKEMTMPEVDMDFANALHKLEEKEKSRTVKIGIAGIIQEYLGILDRDKLAKEYGIDRATLNACITRARNRIRPYLADYFI